MPSFSPDQNVYFVGKKKRPSNQEAISPYLTKQAASMGFIHIAGNLFECPSSKDLWKIRGGKIIRLTGNEVDNAEKVKPSDSHNPARFLRDILSDLEF